MQLLEEFQQIIGVFETEGIEYALCGGLAMAVYAMPRSTLDIDIMIELDSLFHAKRTLDPLGFKFPAAPLSFHDGAIQIYRLSKITLDTLDALILDLLMVTPQTRDAWESRQTVEWEGGSLSVIAPRGLITLKLFRGKGQDRDDIDYLRSIIDED